MDKSLATLMRELCALSDDSIALLWSAMQNVTPAARTYRAAIESEFEHRYKAKLAAGEIL